MRTTHLILFILAILPASQVLGGGRPVIAGRVVNEQTGQPLQEANVFLANSLIGSPISSDGSFLLAGFSRGVYVLVVSCVGYDVFTQQMQVAEADSIYLSVALRPKLIEQKEVVVKGEQPKEWTRLLKYFKSVFIGETDNAPFCTILNPEVVDLSIRQGTKTLLASAERSIIVENRGLGFRLQVILANFSWDIDEDHGSYFIYPAFQELKPSEGDSIRWAARRRAAYLGSLKHFFAALVAGRTEREGFEVHCGSYMELEQGFGHPVSAEEISVQRDPLSAYWNVDFKDWLRVRYKKTRGTLVSYISMKGEALLVDYLGNVADPLRLSVAGDWAKNRVAELLPLY